MAASEISDLIARVALRDRAAFRALYAATSAKLFGISLRILNNRAEAEDALQEIFVKVWQRAGTYRAGQTSPITWLAAIARNHALDLVRARRPGTEDLDAAAELPDGGPGPEAAALAAGENARLAECLSRLDSQRADAVSSAYMEGYSYAELAERFSVPLNTMRTWLRRSLIQLRECLEQQ